jgi:hypothetical protein
MPKKKVSAEAVVADIRAGVGDDALMTKYELTSAQLLTVFKKLVVDGFVAEEEISARTSLLSVNSSHPEAGPDSETVSNRDTKPSLAAAEKAESSPLRTNGFIGKLSGTATKLIEHVFRTLRNTNRPVRSYAWRAWLISVIPTYVIGSIVVGVLDLPGPQLPDTSPIFLVTFLLYFAPVVETLVMWPILWILRRLIGGQLLVAAASAVIWGVLHGIHSVAQGLTITWGFFVFSMCFMEWEKKSKLTAIGVTALVHMLHNLLPACALILVALAGGQAIEPKVTPRQPPQQQEASVSVDEQTSSTKPSAGALAVGGVRDKATDEKYESFLRAFPEYGEDEYELASDDLYPDWKKNHAPDATWDDFMVVYKEFIEWWTDRGRPMEPGMKLWEQFMAKRKEENGRLGDRAKLP